MRILHNKKHILLLLAILCYLISTVVVFLNKTTTKELAVETEIRLHAKEKVAIEKLKLLSEILNKTNPHQLFKTSSKSISQLFLQEDISYYVYQNDSLIWWNDNKPAVDLYAYNLELKSQLIEIRNGWYDCIVSKDSLNPTIALCALICIKPEYDFENKYINKNFSTWTGLPEKTLLKTDFNYLNPIIKSMYGNSLFEISRNEGVFKTSIGILIASCLIILAILLLLLWFYYWLKTYIKNKALNLVVFIATVFCLRTIMLYFKWPSVIYDTKLYDAKLFANAPSFYFSYLGDALFNSFLILIAVVLIIKFSFKKIVCSARNFYLFFIAHALLLSYFSVYIKTLIISLVNNSTISYNINDFFNFSPYSLIGYLSVSFLMLAFNLSIQKLMELLFNFNKHILSIFSVFMLIVFAIAGFLIKQNLPLFENLWPVLIIVTVFILKKYKATLNFINIGCIVLLTSIIVTELFNTYELLNKKNTYDALSYTLTDRQDVIAENEFTKSSAIIKHDVNLKNLFSLLPLSVNNIEQSIRQANFSGYFERYNIIISIFKDDCTPLFTELNDQYLQESYFTNQIEKYGRQTISDELYFIDKEKQAIRYVAKIKLDNISNPDKKFRLYLQMEPKQAGMLGNFPDLLLDKSLENKLESKNISYALYQNNKLIYSFGDYYYPLFKTVKTFNNTLSKTGFTHNVYLNTQRTTVIISDNQYSAWKKFTSISYLFIFFSVIVFSGIVSSTFLTTKRVSFSTLNNRIQFILVTIVVLSLTGVVIGTVWAVTSQFEIKNKNELTKKAQSVLKELQLTLGTKQSFLQTQKELTVTNLRRLSHLFGSDITLFDASGLLYATSQPAIYDQGLVSKFMNPIAYSNFKQEALANFSQKESIGKLNYLSAYIPFYNINDQLIGYINLPYFSRQKDLEKELTVYLTTLINIYTILFAITTLLALLVSNLLTKPLRIIKQQISNIKFGKHNDALVWNTKDEIGDLVKEYNTMLLKLEESTQLLAQSEREGAWREMAKQVAHEIKNPLTPMKLNIQHLQRIVDTNPDDLNERVKRVSTMLIEQIDTLSHIATVFSNFAKLPNTLLEIVNLNDVLITTTDLFKQNSQCDLILNAPKGLYIKADKEQCVRIFTNLIKNAEQAIPENRQGKIVINVEEINSQIIIKITDNGIGISDESKQKLFTPNFTTKSTGTGLGLAMVKNSVIEFKGTITYETKLNSGTTFILTFNKCVA